MKETDHLRKFKNDCDEVITPSSRQSLENTSSNCEKSSSRHIPSLIDGFIESRSSCDDVIIGDDIDIEGDVITGEYDVIGEVGSWQSGELKYPVSQLLWDSDGEKSKRDWMTSSHCGTIVTSSVCDVLPLSGTSIATSALLSICCWLLVFRRFAAIISSSTLMYSIADCKVST